MDLDLDLDNVGLCHMLMPAPQNSVAVITDSSTVLCKILLAVENLEVI